MRRNVIFLVAVAHHWGSLVTGGVAIGIIGTYQGTGHSVPAWVYWAVAGIAIVVAFYRAWLDQFLKAEKLQAEITARRNIPPVVPHVDVHVSQSNFSLLDSRPQIAMRAIQPSLDVMRGMSFEGAPFPEVEFRLRHLSGRPATSINVSEIGSLNGHFSIRFDLLSFLPMNSEESIGFEVGKTEGFTPRKAIALGGRTRLLSDFIFDSRNGDKEVHFPFTVWFMDGVEPLSKRQRLIYNFDTRKFDVIDEYPPLNTYNENLDRI